VRTLFRRDVVAANLKVGGLKSPDARLKAGATRTKTEFSLRFCSPALKRQTGSRQGVFDCRNWMVCRAVSTSVGRHTVETSSLAELPWLVV
jgi:hypothetical protein